MKKSLETKRYFAFRKYGLEIYKCEQYEDGHMESWDEISYWKLGSFVLYIALIPLAFYLAGNN
jgi:hypothetical protein